MNWCGGFGKRIGEVIAMHKERRLVPRRPCIHMGLLYYQRFMTGLNSKPTVMGSCRVVSLQHYGSDEGGSVCKDWLGLA